MITSKIKINEKIKIRFNFDYQTEFEIYFENEN